MPLSQTALRDARRLGPAYVERMLEKGLHYRKPKHLRQVTASWACATGWTLARYDVLIDRSRAGS